MTMRVRAGLMLMAALAMMGLASCGHYICSEGANFGASTCTSSGRWRYQRQWDRFRISPV